MSKISNKNIVGEGFKITTQTPADDRLLFQNLTDLLDLGTNNSRALTYYEGMRVWVIDEKKEYEWLESTSGVLTSSFVYPDDIVTSGVNYSLRSFNFQETPGGASAGSGTSDHNALINLQGGKAVPKEYIHLTQSEYNDLKTLIYKPPTLAANPSFLGGTVEIGQTYSYNQPITITIGNLDSVLLNRIRIDGSFNSPIPVTTQLNKSGTATLKSNVLMELAIQRDDNNAFITANVIQNANYYVFWFALPVTLGNLLDAGSFSDSDLVDVLKEVDLNYTGIPIKQFRNNKSLGDVNFAIAELSNIYVVNPVSYGTPQIAPQAFPTAFLNTQQRQFTYTHIATDTQYRITKVDDVMGGNYPAKII